jgi:hypothetical protein
MNKLFAAIFFSATLAVATVQAQTVAPDAEQKLPECVSTKRVNLDYTHNFWTEMRVNPRTRDKYADSIYFSDADPHYLKIYVVGKNLNSNECYIHIDVVEKRTLSEIPLLYNQSLVETDDNIVIGGVYNKLHQNVLYIFKILNCKYSFAGARNVMQMEITRDLSASGIQCIPNETIPHPTDEDPNLSWNMTGFTKEIRSGLPEIITVTRGANPTIGSEVSRSREVSFTQSKGNVTSSGIDLGSIASNLVGINLHGLQDNLQKSVDNAASSKFEQTETSTFSLTLDWNECNTWRIDRYKTNELGYVSAPKYGISEQLPFYVTLSHRVEGIPLCEKGTNIATKEAIERERAAIAQMKF